MDVDLIQAGYIQVDSKGGIAQGNLDLGAGNGKLTLTQEGHNFSGVCFWLPGERFLCMTVIVCVCVLGTPRFMQSLVNRTKLTATLRSWSAQAGAFEAPERCTCPQLCTRPWFSTWPWVSAWAQLCAWPWVSAWA